MDSLDIVTLESCLFTKLCRMIDVVPTPISNPGSFSEQSVYFEYAIQSWWPDRLECDTIYHLARKGSPPNYAATPS